MTFGILATVPLVSFPRRTVVTSAICVKLTSNCIARLNEPGSTTVALHAQSIEVDCTTSAVGTESEMPAAHLTRTVVMKSLEVGAMIGAGVKNLKKVDSAERVCDDSGVQSVYWGHHGKILLPSSPKKSQSVFATMIRWLGGATEAISRSREGDLRF
ncbi:hypothetical protein C8R46DRAFT_1065465 [Mycena filopes]|nr:hypothetical protein C8R46DRAFT_1065465 [Mycena filopes]